MWMLENPLNLPGTAKESSFFDNGLVECSFILVLSTFFPLLREKSSLEGFEPWTSFRRL